MRKILLICLVLLLCSCSVSLFKIEDTKELMGTFVTITIYDLDNGRANSAMGKAFEEIERIDKLMSTYDNSSEVFMLNKKGFLQDASDELVYVIEKSLYYGNLSGGAFDITVKPILELYTKSFSELKRPPTGSEINATLGLIDYDNVIIREKTIAFKDGKMGITLGGIAKGYAIDRAIEVLMQEGIEHALVNAGGDMRAIGSKGNEDWKIALQNPRDENEHITIIPLAGKSVTTSGDYERYFDEGKKFHHIVNPLTGYSATELISVTIIADEAIDADAIATSVFVLGADEGLELVESLDNVEGLLITSEREIMKSSGFGY